MPPRGTITLVVLFSLGLNGMAFPQEAVSSDDSSRVTISADRETIRQLVQQVKKLQEQVSALEGKQSATSVAADTVLMQPALEQPAQDASSSNGSAAADVRETHDLRGIQWRGFGEVNYKVLDQRKPELGTFGFNPGSAGNFYIGDFDLYLTSKLTDKASVLAELVVGEEVDQTFSVELARALLKYDSNDHLRLSVGRYHTNVGFYNAAFLSGKWLQTTVDRPLVMEFSDAGGLLPTQAIGLSVTGQIPSGRLGLNYVAEYGSADTIRPALNGGGEADENNGNYFNVSLLLRPEAVPGLQVGASYYHDRISNFFLVPKVRLGQTIVNGHVVHTGHGFESQNEAFLIRNAYEESGPIYNMPAFDTQFAV